MAGDKSRRSHFAGRAVVLLAVFGAALFMGGCGDFWQAPTGTGGNSNGIATTTDLSAPATANVGDSVTLTATVDQTAATGTVSFSSNGGSIGSAPLTSGTATATTSFTAAGTYSLTASYSGDDTYAGSTSSAVSITVSAASGASQAANPGAPLLAGQTQAQP